jgi:hypothetical protein
VMGERVVRHNCKRFSSEKAVEVEFVGLVRYSEMCQRGKEDSSTITMRKLRHVPYDRRPTFGLLS